jgi:hypothetical protein
MRNASDLRFLIYGICLVERGSSPDARCRSSLAGRPLALATALTRAAQDKAAEVTERLILTTPGNPAPTGKPRRAGRGGVGVGGDHEAGVAEPALNDLEVGAGGVRQTAPP